jgi:hypothetical protein
MKTKTFFFIIVLLFFVLFLCYLNHSYDFEPFTDWSSYSTQEKIFSITTEYLKNHNIDIPIKQISFRNTNCVSGNGSFGYAVDVLLENGKYLKKLHLCLPKETIGTKCYQKTITNTINKPKCYQRTINNKIEKKSINESKKKENSYTSKKNIKSIKDIFDSLFQIAEKEKILEGSKWTSWVPFSKNLNEECSDMYGPNYGVMRKKTKKHEQKGLCSKVYWNYLPKYEKGSTYCTNKNNLETMCKSLFGKESTLQNTTNTGCFAPFEHRGICSFS